MTLRLFTVFAIAGAVASALLGGWLAILLGHPAAFQGLVGWVMVRSSADGVLSSEGLGLITQTVRLLMKVCMAGAVGLLAVGVLLRRVWRAHPIPEPAVTAAGDTHLPEASWWPARVWGAVALTFVIAGAILRAPHLSTSLFYDEIVSIQRFATLPLTHIPFTQIVSNNHVLNSLLLHVILKLSSSEALLRLPVYLAGIASLWLFFLLVRRIGGPLAGVFAVALAATSTYHLWYSILARGYMLGMCLTLAGLVVFVHATQRPSRLARWSFGMTQALASLALPTLSLVPAILLGWLLLGAWPAARRLVGVDPRSPTGSAWLRASLWTVAAAVMLNLPMAPFLLLRAASADAGPAFAGESRWLSVFRYGWIGIGLMTAIAGLGLVEWFRRPPGTQPWSERFCLALWLCSGAWWLLQPELVRMHVVAFVGVIVLMAMGLRALVVQGVCRALPAQARVFAGAAVSGILLLGIVACAWDEVCGAVRATPFEDIRGAVQVAESCLPQHGHMLTSGFADREIAYYASRPVQFLESMDALAAWGSASQPFCYFRLYARGDADPVFAYFRSSGPPGIVIKGVGDPIAVWCFTDGKPISINTKERHVDQQRRLADRPS
jgi:hypothetical protein